MHLVKLDFTSLQNCIGGMNAMLPKYILSVGVLMKVVPKSDICGQLGLDLMAVKAISLCFILNKPFSEFLCSVDA